MATPNRPPASNPLRPEEPAAQRREPAVQRPRIRAASESESSESVKKIVLQPRLCTLRSYGSDRVGVIWRRKDGGDGVGAAADEVSASPFFGILSEYIESWRKSQDFEIASGRFAMVVFAATVTTEMATGTSVFKKMELQRIVEAAGVCFGAVVCAAAFAWFSSTRNRVGRIFAVRCNTFIDSLIDHVVDGLFYETNPSDWSDDI